MTADESPQAVGYLALRKRLREGAGSLATSGITILMFSALTACTGLIEAVPKDNTAVRLFLLPSMFGTGILLVASAVLSRRSSRPDWLLVQALWDTALGALMVLGALIIARHVHPDNTKPIDVDGAACALGSIAGTALGLRQFSNAYKSLALYRQVAYLRNTRHGSVATPND